LCTIERSCMGYESISVTPVTPRIGAYVEGVTLAKPLSNRQVEELHQALAQRQVLFFRDQPLDVETHKRFGRYFGELHIHPSTRPRPTHILGLERAARLPNARAERGSRRQGRAAVHREIRGGGCGRPPVYGRVWESGRSGGSMPPVVRFPIIFRFIPKG